MIQNSGLSFRVKRGVSSPNIPILCSIRDDNKRNQIHNILEQPLGTPQIAQGSQIGESKCEAILILVTHRA